MLLPTGWRLLYTGPPVHGCLESWRFQAACPCGGCSVRCYSDSQIALFPYCGGSRADQGGEQLLANPWAGGGHRGQPVLRDRMVGASLNRFGQQSHTVTYSRGQLGHAVLTKQTSRQSPSGAREAGG